MKIYTDKYGNVFNDACPNPFHLDGDSYSPISDEKFIELGGSIEDDGEILTPEQREFRDSDCCVYFRSLVTSVRQETGDDSFTGGYEEWPDLKKNYPEICEKYISLFNALDNWCKKDAGKYGWGSPEWFYICWDRQPPKKNE